MKNFKEFLKRKDIVVSRQRYLIDTLSAMAVGFFASLIVGLVLETIGNQLELAFEPSMVSGFLIELGQLAKSLTGAAIGVSVAWGLKAPPVVMFACLVVGSAGNALGDPIGALVSTMVACEIGKMISKETKLDILVTPVTTLVVGMLAAVTLGPIVKTAINFIGSIIVSATSAQPLLMGIIVSVIMGIVLTAPISSAALSIILGITGIAGGAATAGCSAHMVGFAVAGFAANGFGGLLSVGIGTSMLQVPNIVKNPYIILPPILTSAITGGLATTLFKMENSPEGSGMGTCGFVGQITTFNTMGTSMSVVIRVILLHFVLPAILTLVFDFMLRKLGKIKQSDYKLNTEI